MSVILEIFIGNDLVMQTIAQIISAIKKSRKGYGIFVQLPRQQSID
jgi:hypothetical protein